MPLFLLSEATDRSEDDDDDDDVAALPAPNNSDSNNNNNTADRVFSEALMSLSFQERCRIEEEIHGVRNYYPTENETPQFIRKALEKLDTELTMVASRQGIQPSWIPSNRFFRLRFLRTCCFNVSDAAKRTVKYLSLVRELCACGGGVQNCACGSLDGGRINVSKWFRKEEHKFLRSGCIQLLPYRDRSGRRVVCVMRDSVLPMPISSRIKYVLYILTEASEDAETQQNGFVVVIFLNNNDDIVADDPHGLKSRIFRALPLRVASIHVCGSKKFMELAKEFLAVMLGRFLQIRVKFIDGSPTEVRYSLLSFGIAAEMIPLRDDGGIKLRNHLKWLEYRAAFQDVPFSEVHTTTDGKVAMECPGVNDVVFSRGKLCHYNPGNQTFRSLLLSKKSQHLLASQTEKKLLVKQIAMELRASNQRFLMWENKVGLWIEILDQNLIRHKIATHIRDLYKILPTAVVVVADRNKSVHLDSSTNVFLNQSTKRQKLGRLTFCPCIHSSSLKLQDE